MLGGAVLVPITVFNGDFVRLWVGHNNYVNDNFSIACSVLALLVGLDFFMSAFLKAVGIVREQIIPETVGGLINISLSIFLIQKIGLVGPILATVFITLALIIFNRIVLVKKIFKINRKTILLNTLYIFLWITIWFMFAFFIKSKLSMIVGWPQLLLSLSTIGLLYSVSTWVVIVKKSERRKWKIRLSKYIK